MNNHPLLLPIMGAIAALVLDTDTALYSVGSTEMFVLMPVLRLFFHRIILLRMVLRQFQSVETAGHLACINRTGPGLLLILITTWLYIVKMKHVSLTITWAYVMKAERSVTLLLLASIPAILTLGVVALPHGEQMTVLVFDKSTALPPHRGWHMLRGLIHFLIRCALTDLVEKPHCGIISTSSVLYAMKE
jgi:predicted membrane-bound dolichyl-phosphate-mannose-protein mannosyltransferase